MGWTFYNASGEAMIIDGGLHDILEDTTPQLGGNLDMQARLLVGNGGSTGIAISAAGEVTMAAQPSVLAYNSGNLANVTGDNTAYTGVYGSEVWDTNADWDGTSTFTAPITGKYLISVNAFFSGITSSITSGDMRFDASNRNSANIALNPYLYAAGGSANWTATNTLDMDASDTLTIRHILRNGAQVADFEGNADLRNSISISLLH
jgi:hypothetical protein